MGGIVESRLHDDVAVVGVLLAVGIIVGAIVTYIAFAPVASPTRTITVTTTAQAVNTCFDCYLPTLAENGTWYHYHDPYVAWACPPSYKEHQDILTRSVTTYGSATVYQPVCIPSDAKILNATVPSNGDIMTARVFVFSVVYNQTIDSTVVSFAPIAGISSGTIKGDFTRTYDAGVTMTLYYGKASTGEFVLLKNGQYVPMLHAKLTNSFMFLGLYWR